MVETTTEKPHSRLHVLVVTTSFPLHGGPPSGPFVQRLVENLPQCVEATVLAPCFGRHQDYNAPSGYRVRCFRYAPISWQRLAHVPGGIPVALRSSPFMYMLLPWFLLCMSVACWRAAKGADIIHANWSVNGVMAGLVARIRRVPTITTLRGEDVSRASKSRLFRWLLVRCLSMSSRIVTVSEALQEQLIHQFPAWAWKIRFAPNGIERTLLSREIGLGRTGILNIVAVGSLIPRKSVSTLIRALRRLPERDAVRLVIVGDGPERDELQHSVSELGIGHSVSFTGSIQPDKVIQYLEVADVLVLCSRSEGRPNVVLEAMAAGLTVVATTIPGVTEIISDGQNGLLFKTDDDVALAGCLERLRTDPELRFRLAQGGRDWIQDQNLFWDSTGSQYAAIYRECLEQQA